jgi:hypothetical protein
MPEGASVFRRERNVKTRPQSFPEGEGNSNFNRKLFVPGQTNPARLPFKIAPWRLVSAWDSDHRRVPTSYRRSPITGVHSMITFVRTANLKPAMGENEQNRFQEIRKAAAERRRKADTDGSRRLARQTAEGNRLL